MTSPAPPNTRQVSPPLNLFIYLRHFERVAFKSGVPLINCYIAKLIPTRNGKKFQQVRIIQDTNWYELILSVFVC